MQPTKSKKDFTLSSEVTLDSLLEAVLEGHTVHVDLDVPPGGGRGETTPMDRKTGDASSSDAQKRGESTLQRLEKIGLHPKKNVDIISLVFYTVLLPATTQLLNSGHFKSALLLGALALVLATLMVMTKKGDMATILRHLYNAWLTGRGQRAQYEMSKESELSVWGRLEEKKK